MILIHNKDFETLSNEVMISLNEVGFDTTAGSIARLFSDIICKNISDLYDRLTVDHALAFLTTSSGLYLDSIGKLLNCSRNLGELDEDYKVRISNQVTEISRANETAIRLSILSIDGVDDVKIKKYSHGPGSMTIVPIINSNANSTINEKIKSTIDQVISCGEKVIIKNPIPKYFKIDITLITSISVEDSTKQEISILVRDSINKYINTKKWENQFILIN